MAKQVPVVLGEKYRDKLTGWEGTAVTRCDYYGNHTLYSLTALGGPPGEQTIKHEYFRADRLENLKGKQCIDSPRVQGNVVLGEEYIDKVTGLVGIASCRIQMINGCIQYTLEQGVKEDGTMRDAWNIDDARLISVKENAPAEPDPAPRGSVSMSPAARG